MNIMELGAIGELVGGLAVIASLIYVGLQVRQGNQVEKGETHRAFASDWNRQVLVPFTDAEMAPFLRRANAGFEVLSEDDKFRATGFWGMQVFLTEELFSLHNAGTVETGIWEASALRMAALLQMPGPAQWWRISQQFYSTEFVAYINARMTGPASPPPIHELMPWFAATEESPLEAT